MDPNYHNGVTKITNAIASRQITKTKGHRGNYFFESILVDSKPKFLVYDKSNKHIAIHDSIEDDNNVIMPLKEFQCGYRPYNFTQTEIVSLLNKSITKEELLDEIKILVDRYIVAEDITKHLIQIDILISYCQEWITTLHFPYSVGDTESGKSTILHLASWLCYRCHLGEDIPMADIYNFLGKDEEACGTIAEDEAQGLDPRSEKMRMYKSSYAKGSKKARILGTDTPGKQQVFYNTYCQKWFAGEKIPNNKGFVERLAVIHMISGVPHSNIKRPSKNEARELNILRNKLLIWKLQNIENQFHQIDSNFKNRDAELWDDFLRVAYDTKYFDDAKKVADSYVAQRQDGIRNSFEARLFKIVLTCLNDDYEVKALSLWDNITNNNSELPGSIDEKTAKTFYPDEFGVKLTPNLLARTLEHTFNSKKKVRNIKDGSKMRRETTYAFTKEIIYSFVYKYGITLESNMVVYSCPSGPSGQIISLQ